MPPHIKHAKLLKQAIDDKANVIEMDDKPDEDGELGDEGQYVVPDFGLEVDWCGEEGEPATATGTGIGGGDSRASETGALTVGDICEAPTVNRLEAFASAACPAPVIAASPALQPRTTGTTAARKVKATTVTPSATKPPAARDYQPGSRDEQEAQRYRTMVNWSNRLGGTSLYSFREADAQKHGREERDADQLEASYAKACTEGDDRAQGKVFRY
ncbi:hypothetical protein DVH05_011295 [Phytophthora capsici]|nr:hypothetical protein DVH05_011295 [Phytophthora capsici]